MSRHLYLFDDRVARGWEPFALTRPVGELPFGALLLRERIERATGLPAEGYLGSPDLLGFEEENTPAVRLLEEPEGPSDRLLLSTRYVPPLPGQGGGPTLDLPAPPPGGLVLVTGDGAVAGRLLSGNDPPLDPETLTDPGRWLESEGNDDAAGSGPTTLEVPGELLEAPWDLMARNPDRLAEDLPALHPEGASDEAGPLPDLPGVHRIGDHPVSAGKGVIVDPSVVLDTRSGPIHLADGAHLRPFTHLRGPALIGPDSVLLGGLFEGVSCGPVCKLRGEIDSSVILGYSNKAHDGYLGHSLVGRWVNLGAFTTNSDLKNNYGRIRVTTAAGERDTGLMKVGVFLGDHVKTGIGTLLNGGTLVGAGANVFGGALGMKRVPPFAWGSGDRFAAYRLDAFLETAERAMGRRGKRLTSGMKDLLSRAWDQAWDRASAGASGAANDESSDDATR